MISINKIISKINLVCFVIILIINGLSAFNDPNNQLYYRLGIYIVFSIFYLVVFSGCAIYFLLLKNQKFKSNILSYIFTLILIIQTLYYFALIFAELKHW